MNPTCSICGTQPFPGAAFCQRCGATLGATTVQQRTQVMQGAMVNDYASFSRANEARTQTAPSGGKFLPPLVQNIEQQLEDTFVVMDVSGSMAEKLDNQATKLEAAARAQGNMALQKYQIDPRDRLGIVTFDDVGHLVLPLSEIGQNKRKILQILKELQIGGGTDIDVGLCTAADSFDWTLHDVVRRIVLLTDGHGGHPLRTAQSLKDKGCVIDVVGIGPSPAEVDEKLLKKVASIIQGEVRYRFIKDHKALMQHYTDLGDKTHTQ